MIPTPTDTPLSVLVLTGAVGGGKSSVAAAMADQLAERHQPHALIDMDWLRACAPAPASDPFHTTLGLHNLAAVAATYRAAGARALLLVDVVEDGAMAAVYATAIPNALLTIVRLVAPLTVIEERLRGRHMPGASLDWHLGRAAELVVQLEQAQVEDLVIDTAGRTSGEIAATILQRVLRVAP